MRLFRINVTAANGSEEDMIRGKDQMIEYTTNGEDDMIQVKQTITTMMKKKMLEIKLSLMREKDLRIQVL